ncbi:MAG: hypothetical protein H5T86_12125, partial [Armatimonadetes bacterium]|nr:hypothetical protein [Armatimonadota bacterium]
SVSLRADPKKPVTARIDLGAPERPTAMVLPIEVSAGTSKMVIERGVIVDYGPRKVVDVPQRWQGGMRLRGQPETFDFGQTGAHVRAGEQSCGGDRRKAITMHPPYVGGVGYAFARLDPIRLPPKPKAVFRALVGKGDGSDPGDGILYRVAVIDESGQETVLAEKTVAQHKWELIEADLSRFAGKEVQLKLISDVGPNDNSIGDWACWADLRIETPGTELTYTLLDDPYALRREPGPHMIQGVTEEQLRTARRGWLHYDGMGLSGNIPPYQTYAELNGVPIGMLAPAGGDEVHGKWAEDVRLELPREAIAALRPLNQLVIHNPQRDYFKVRRFWIELELQDGRKCSSYISDVTFTQPPEWPYAEGILVPFSRAITVYISF